MAVTKAETLVNQAVRLPSGVTLLVQQLQDVDAASLGIAAQRLQERLGDSAAVVLGSAADDKVSIVAAFSPAVVKAGASAGSLVGPLAKLCGGGGGGKPTFAQAGGRDASKLGEAMVKAREQLEAMLNK